MKKETQNWTTNPQQLSFPEKISTLLSMSNKLVLNQVHELERLKLKKNNKKSGTQLAFINYLYDHYVIQGMPKTYLASN